MLDSNNKFRLQFLNHDEVFADRETATNYITDYLKPDVLVAEPAVVFYGDKSSPNAILAIGSGNKKVYMIDITKIEEELSNISSQEEEQVKEISKATKTIKSIIDACGLKFDDNKIENQVTYEPDNKDVVIGDAATIAEAVSLLSKYVQEIGKSTKFTVADSTSVKMIYKEDPDLGEKVLKAKVKISDNGDSDDEEFNNNIIGIKSDGLYAAVHLEYDELRNELKFYSSGMKNGRFQDDAKKQIINLGKHLELKSNNSDDNPIKVTVKTENNESKISAKIALSEHDNILKVTDGKLTALVSMSYNESNNQITFNNGIESKTFTLNSGGVLENAYYDSNTETIVLRFKLSNGQYSEVKIPVRGILNEWGVDNTNKTVILTKTVDEGSGKDLLSADVNISTNSDNILVNNGGSLYVGGVSSNIRYKEITVAKALDSLEKADVKFAEDLIKEVNDRTNAIEKVVNQLEQEIKDREHADEDIKHLISDLDIEGLKSTVEEFKSTYSEFEKEWASYKVQIEKAIADAETVVGKVNEIEKKLVENETNLNNLIERVDRAENNINNNAAKIADNTLAITNEATLARQNESDLKNALENEVTRSTTKDEELASGVSENKSNIETLKSNVGTLQSDLTSEVERAKGVENTLTQSVENIKSTADQNKSDIAINLQKLNDEINRSTSKDSEIEGKINDEVGRAKGEENRLETLINTNKEGIAENKSNIGALSTSVAGLRNELENEVNRAKGEEKRIDEKVNDLVTSSSAAVNNALEQSKNYTDAEILKANANASEDATSKANKALADAKSYSDEKLALETSRAQASEQANANAVSELKAKDAELEANVAKKVENVRIEKNSVSDLQYTLYVDDKPCGEINIPKDQFLKDVRYDKGTTSLVFTWEIGDEHPETNVDVSDFLTAYNAGNGLKLEDYVFSVKLTTANESYLQVTEDGVQLVGIDAKFDSKADKNDVYTKLEVDNAVEAETIRAKSIEEGLQNSIDAVNSNASALTERVAETESKLNVIQGNSAQEGSIEKALVDAKNYANSLINEEVLRAKEAEKTIETNAKSYTDELATKVSANEEAIAILNNNFAVEGSVANAIYQSKNYTDEKISEINTEVSKKANIEDVYTKEQIDNKGYLTSTDIENFATKSEVEAETERAKIAEGENKSAIAEVKTIAESNSNEITQLQKDILSLEPSVEETNSVKMIMNKSANGTVYSSDLKLDLEKANILKVSGNGLYAEVNLEYNTAENKLTFVAGGVSKDIQLAGANIIKEGHYDSTNREIVLTLEDGSQIKVPVSDLFNQLKPINPDNDPVNLVIEHNSDGQDTIQANLNISSSEDNLILNNNGTLFASKRATQHVMKFEGIGDDIDVQSAVNMVKKSVDENTRNIETIQDDVTKLKENVSKLTEAVNDHENRISESESSIANIQTTLNEYNTRLEKVEGNVTNIQESLTNIQETINNIQNEIGGSGDGEMSIKDRLAALEEICNNLIDFGLYN